MFRPVCQTLWTLTICFSLAAVDSTVWAGASNVSIKAKDGKFQVMAGDDLFCEVLQKSLHIGPSFFYLLGASRGFKRPREGFEKFLTSIEGPIGPKKSYSDF